MNPGAKLGKALVQAQAGDHETARALVRRVHADAKTAGHGPTLAKARHFGLSLGLNLD